MGCSGSRGSIGGRIWSSAAWVLPVVLAVAACGGSSSSGDDDDDGGAGGDDGGAGKGGGGAGSGGTSAGRGGTGGGVTGTGGSGPIGKAGSGGQAGRGGTGAGGVTTAGTGGTGTPTHVGDCDEFTPCGGDPEGTWRVNDTCVEVTFGNLPAGCETMLRDVAIEVEGTYAFANGTVTADAAMNSTVTVEVDDTCAKALSGSQLITAEALCPVLEAQGNDDPEAMMTCEYDGAVCVCLQSQMPVPEQNTDTYTISGTQLISSDGSALDFCVEGDSLLLKTAPEPTDGGMLSAVEVVLELTRE